ncbi:type III secretion system stator protein SctL [Schlegelella sp. S2-27]|uniref:Flagellar assembly protein FliH n=1 Tax=Caldimonas mangrovi TaxID=2944811 RepID=A0ABT0YTM0_9BURK|nr:type III secretion system stator protein SctL [Caldimonas mangrovi]MCM5681451.1 type III secretion system stator protein SctL [Caldimonas mangrovi]
MAMLIWLQTAAGPVGVEEGVVRAEEVQALVSVQELQRRMEQSVEQMLSETRRQAAAEMEAAQAQAREIIDDAREEAQGLRQAAYEEGTRQAVSEWHERHLQAAIGHDRAVREMHARLADVVTSAVERIVLYEDRGALYQRALKSVQSLTRGNGSLRLRVGMDDYAQARDCLGAMDHLQEAGLELDVVADAALAPGSCIFESDLGVLDASLQTQLAGLRAAMERAVRRAAGGDAAEAPVDGAPPPFGGSAPPADESGTAGQPDEPESTCETREYAP